MDITSLMQEMHNANTEVERVSVKNKITTQFDALSETEKELVRDAFLKSLDNVIDEGKILLKEVDLKIEMLEISKFISLSQVAKKYFGKSRTWLYQRLYGYSVNGKPAQFTPAERQTLATALKDIAQMAQNTSLKIA